MQTGSTPTPNPSPQGGGEEYAAPSRLKLAPMRVAPYITVSDPSGSAEASGYPAHSGINAKVHKEPPVGTLACTNRGATAPPNPDATDTYCRPLWV